MDSLSESWVGVLERGFVALGFGFSGVEFLTHKQQFLVECMRQANHLFVLAFGTSLATQSKPKAKRQRGNSEAKQSELNEANGNLSDAKLNK